MERLTYTAPSGQVLEISQTEENFKIRDFMQESTDIRIIEREGYRQDGTDYLGSLYKAKYITIRMVILASTQYELYEKRAEIQQILQIKSGMGTLQYTNDYLSRSIQCTLLNSISYTRVSYGVTVAEFTLKATHPYWLDNDYTCVEVFEYVGGLKFPLILPTIFATIEQSKEIINNGDVPAPVRIEFFGTALNPRIEKEETGEFIQVNTTLNAGDTLLITTEYGNKDVIYYPSGSTEGVKAFDLIDPESTFFYLDVGVNNINYTTDAGTPQVTICYKQQYTGV